MFDDDLLQYQEYMSPVYNSFEQKPIKDNTAEIKALLLVQSDIIKAFLTEKEAFVLNYCICKEYPQKAVAKMLNVNPSCVNKSLKSGIKKMRKIIAVCDKAIRYYQQSFFD